MKQQRQPGHAAAGTRGEQAAPNRSRRRLLGWTAGSGASLLGALVARGAVTRRVEAQAPAQAPRIVGSWLLSFPNAQSNPNEREIYSFTSDGIVFGTNTPSAPPDPVNGSPTRTYTTAGQGAWVAVGANQVRIKFMVVDSDDQGNFADLVQITATLTVAVDGSSFTGSYQFRLSDADGNVLLAPEGDAGTVQGTRISV